MPKLQIPKSDPVTDPNIGVLTEPEAAHYLRLSVWTLRRLHRDPERYGQPPRKLQLSANRNRLSQTQPRRLAGRARGALSPGQVTHEVGLDHVAAECPMIANMLATGGAGRSQTIWSNTVLLSTFTRTR